MGILTTVWSLALAMTCSVSATPSNSTFFNPILPGWHSDPSCVFVAEKDNTFFCATSTFLITPGIPIYASKDLVNWKLASHVLNRPSQVPYMNISGDQNDGIFAPTLRYKDGVFYLITDYVFRVTNAEGSGGVRGLLFNSTDPFSDDAWNEPVNFDIPGIDPDIFWHENGKVYMTYTNIAQREIDPATGEVGQSYQIWNGTGLPFPEGPHIYQKDDYYYLMIGEGGTETNHSVTIARSKNIDGPYESYERNPVLTARGTDEYFQTVGHADLFQDAAGNWWGVALSTRSGPEWKNYPMGRETILTPVSWATNDWPVMDRVKGKQRGWPLPPPNKNVPGKGPFLGGNDVVDFAPGSSIPPHFSYWRWPVQESYMVSPLGHPHTLRLKPSKVISASPDEPFAGADGITILLRLQQHTLFTYSVDVSFDPKVAEEEVGVSAFLTQLQHIDLGIVNLPVSGANSGGKLAPHLRFRTTGAGTTEGALPETVVELIPQDWLRAPITLVIEAQNDTHYILSAASSRDRRDVKVIGTAPATIVSGGTGPFTGTLVGVYATSNGGNGTTESYISRWRYTGNGQKIDHDVIVPSGVQTTED
ncbi:xylosidase : arabinofuranosidase [Marasmius fiardii PR-910]|nr:xylosidase : arabinofuranosidase [Marasmius fiardii PR-910]